MVERLGQLLIQRKEMLVTAESCTGGGLAESITRIAGSSRWFERGFVTYSNDAKREMLQVQAITLQKFHAVSEETALEMAEGALKNSHAQISVAITGIAGPDGGTLEKPVGTVCFAWSHRNNKFRSAKVYFDGARQQIRQQSCMLALQGLLDMVEV